MDNIKETLEARRQKIVDSRRVLHNSKDEPTGQALRALLEHQLAQLVQQLKTARGEDFIFAQGGVKQIETMIAYQQKAEIQLAQ